MRAIPVVLCVLVLVWLVEIIVTAVKAVASFVDTVAGTIVYAITAVVPVFISLGILVGILLVTAASVAIVQHSRDWRRSRRSRPESVSSKKESVLEIGHSGEWDETTYTSLRDRYGYNRSREGRQSSDSLARIRRERNRVIETHASAPVAPDLSLSSFDKPWPESTCRKRLARIILVADSSPSAGLAGPVIHHAKFTEALNLIIGDDNKLKAVTRYRVERVELDVEELRSVIDGAGKEAFEALLEDPNNSTANHDFRDAIRKSVPTHDLASNGLHEHRAADSVSIDASTFAVMRRRVPRLAGLPGFLGLWLVGGLWAEIGWR